MAFCGNCGANLASGSAFCHGCGQPVAQQSTISAVSPVQPARPSEQTFLQGQDLLVTNTRFIRGNETFAVSGITSVSSYTEVPSKMGPIVLTAIGALVFLGGLQSDAGLAFLGAVMMGLGILWFRSIKNIYHVRLVTSSGERDALSSPDIAHVGKIVAAINEAIVYRG
jgi:hypothetical protein